MLIAEVKCWQLGAGVRRRSHLDGVAMAAVSACCAGHVMCRFVCFGQKPSPAYGWWSDDDILDVVLSSRGRHFWSFIRPHKVSG
jgi:hypothetical protein